MTNDSRERDVAKGQRPVPRMDAVFGFTGEYEEERWDKHDMRVERYDELIFEVRAPRTALENVPRISRDAVWSRFTTIDVVSNVGWIAHCYARLTFNGLLTHIHTIINVNLWAVNDGSIVVTYHRVFSVVPDFDGGDPLTYAPIAVYVRCVQDYFGPAVSYGANLGYMRDHEHARPGSVAWICDQSRWPATTPVMTVMECARRDVLSVEELYADRLVTGDVLKPQRAVDRVRLGRKLGRIEQERLRAEHGLDVVGPLGSGGMGQVYEAVDSTGDRVAVKILAPDERFDVTDVSANLLEREMAALQSLSGLGIAPTFIGKGVCLGRSFYVQELLPWPNLEQWLAETKRSLPHKVTVITALRDAVGRMHRRGIVHRDINPKNILVDPDSLEIRLIDFGGAIGPALPSYEHDPEVRIGSLRYSAPELRDSPSRASASSDVFSVGVIAHEIVLERHIAGNVPELTRLEPDMPREVSDYAQRAVSFLPELRPS